MLRRVVIAVLAGLINLIILVLLIIGVSYFEIEAELPEVTSPTSTISAQRATPTAFRFSTLELMDPHTWTEVPLFGCQDVTNVVVFLASDQASYMTGQAINVTGGQEMR